MRCWPGRELRPCNRPFLLHRYRCAWGLAGCSCNVRQRLAAQCRDNGIAHCGAAFVLAEPLAHPPSHLQLKAMATISATPPSLYNNQNFTEATEDAVDFLLHEFFVLSRGHALTALACFKKRSVLSYVHSVTGSGDLPRHFAKALGASPGKSSYLFDSTFGDVAILVTISPNNTSCILQRGMHP